MGVFLLLFLSCTRMPTAPPAEITVTGNITGPDGTPMAAFLAFHPAGPGLKGTSVRADSLGSYSVRLVIGTYDIVVQPSVSGLLYHAQRVKFTRSSTRFDHWFSGYALNGMVRDPDGAVVDSGRVWIDILTPSPYTIGSTFLTHGSFSFLVSTGTYVLNAESNDPWSAVSRLDFGPFWVGSDTTIAFDMSGTPVTGQVIGPTGTQLRAAVSAEGDGYRARGLTDSEGRYRLWLHTGTYRLRASPYDSIHIVGRSTDPIQIQSPFTTDFDLAGVEWTGEVRWRASGLPVPGVGVTAFDAAEDFLWAGVQTGADGTFRLVVDPGHRYDLTAGHGGVQSIWIERLTAREDTSFVLMVDPDPTRIGVPTPAPPAALGIPSPGPSVP